MDCSISIDNVEDTIEDLEDLGFNIVVADTKELMEYLCSLSFAASTKVKKYVYRNIAKIFQPILYVMNWNILVYVALLWISFREQNQ